MFVFRVRISSSKKIEDLEQCLVKRFSVEVLRFYIGKSSDYSKEVFDQEEEEEEEAGCVNEGIRVGFVYSENQLLLFFVVDL